MGTKICRAHALMILLVCVGCSHFGKKSAGPNPKDDGKLSVVTITPSDEQQGSVRVEDEAGEPVNSVFVAGVRIKNLDFDIPITVNDQVEMWIRYFQTRGRGFMERYLERSGKYRDLIRRTLKEHGVPQDLFYVALIESGFNFRAVSRAQAVGPWQFIKATGRRYGLDVNYWVDERRDVEKATVGAALYFQDLYAMLGDWNLAMAGYNAGEMKILRAIMKHKTRNFWEMCAHGYLRNETKNYVPKFIAAALIDKNREAFGFDHIQDLDPIPYDVVEVKAPLDLFAFAKEGSITFSEIREMNPELLRWSTPADRKENYQLRVPKGLEAKSRQVIAELENKPANVYKSHLVKKGDTVSRIARVYGVSAEYIRLINNMEKRAGKLRPGTKIKIPVLNPSSASGIGKDTGGSRDLLERKIETRAASSTKEPDVIHIVRKGETLSTIAKKYQVSVHELKKRNPTVSKRRKIVGAKLVIPSRQNQKS